uniref:Putative calcium-binding protein CML19 n=1 Tax=Aegilops tauschii TaxID=37682 RepID=M8D0T9_AEGTA
MGFLSWAGRRRSCMTFFGPSMTEKTVVEVRARKISGSSRALREAFRMYEMEGQGCITPASLGRMLGRLGTERGAGECHAMICRFDLDGNGVLSFDEFKIMMS